MVQIVSELIGNKTRRRCFVFWWVHRVRKSLPSARLEAEMKDISYLKVSLSNIQSIRHRCDVSCDSGSTDKCTDNLLTGASIPQQPWRYSRPFSHVPPFFICHPKQFLDIVYAILCNFMRVFSEFWQLSVRDNDPKNKKKIQMELVKHTAWFHF